MALPKIQTSPEDARSKPLSLPPALVEAVQDDPELAVGLARSQLLLVQDKMVQKLLDDPEATVSQYAVVHERLQKTARIEPEKNQGGGSGNQITINFIRSDGREKVVIDAGSTPAIGAAEAEVT